MKSQPSGAQILISRLKWLWHSLPLSVEAEGLAGSSGLGVTQPSQASQSRAGTAALPDLMQPAGLRPGGPPPLLAPWPLPDEGWPWALRTHLWL